MKLRIAVICFCIIAALTTLVVAATYDPWNNDDSASAAFENASSEGTGKATSVTAETDGPYTLRIYEGVLCVFRGEDPETLLYRTEISASSLRESDRTLLEAGVTANTYVEMLALLEDFGS